MYLLSRNRLTKLTEYLLPLAGVFLLQFFLAELLSIQTVRPDFLLIYVLYISIRRGSFVGVITGFILGMLADFAGVGSYFGLSSIVYVITGYLTGYLKGQYSRMIPFYFHLIWIGILLFSFFIFAYVRYQFLFVTDLPVFWGKWFLTAGYTFGFLGILQLVIPLKRVG